MTVAKLYRSLQREKIDGGKGKDKAFFTMVLKFHRVIDDFMIQGGCPLGKRKQAGPGYKIP